MIPKKIHYCWFGLGPMPELAQRCIASWHHYMPDWEYILWNEDRFDVNSIPYTAEAYAAGKYAFVSDYVRLWALCNEGGIYLDVDFEVFKPFDDLLHYSAFAGFEGSKHLPVMMGVIASLPKGEWVAEQMGYYAYRHFIVNGEMDLTPNVTFVAGKMKEQGFINNGMEQDYKDLHIFPVDYFSPRQTTGEYFQTENTYCDHRGLGSWETGKAGWKDRVRKRVGQKNMTRLIKLKRRLFG